MRAQACLVGLSVTVATVTLLSCSGGRNAEREPDEPVFPAVRAGKLGYVDRSGRMAIEPRFDAPEARLGLTKQLVDSDFSLDKLVQSDFLMLAMHLRRHQFSEGLAAVRVNDLWGYIDRSGNVVIEPQFDAAEAFVGGLAAIKVVDSWGRVNRDGDIVVTPQFDFLGRFSDGLARVKVGTDWRVADLSQLQAMGPDLPRWRHLSGNRIEIATEGKWGFVDESGAYVVDPVYEDALPFSEGLAAVELGGRWGFIDASGNVVVRPEYDGASAFLRGVATVLADGKWGYIDQAGEFLIGPRYHAASLEFAEGRAAVEVATSAPRPEPTGFEHGLPAGVPTKWGYIDAQGDVVARCIQTCLGIQRGLGPRGGIRTLGVRPLRTSRDRSSVRRWPRVPSRPGTRARSEPRRVHRQDGSHRVPVLVNVGMHSGRRRQVGGMGRAAAGGGRPPRNTAAREVGVERHAVGIP